MALHLLPQIETFVLYRKIINTLGEKQNKTCIKIIELLKELKMTLKFYLAKHFKIVVKTVKVLFGPIAQEPLGLPKFWC